MPLTLQAVHADCISQCNSEDTCEAFMQQAVQIAAHFAAWVTLMRMLSHKIFMQQAVQTATHFAAWVTFMQMLLVWRREVREYMNIVQHI
jgi:hypothetical protein